MIKIITVSIFSLIISLNSIGALADVKQEIIARCRSQMGEYGSAMVKACVDQDLNSLVALKKYSKRYDSAITRCISTMKEYGYAMVKACVDQDIEAEKELSNY